MSNICSEGCRLSPRPRGAARAHPPAPQRTFGLACQGLSRSSAPLSNRGPPSGTLKLPKLPLQFLSAPHTHLYVEHSGLRGVPELPRLPRGVSTLHQVPRKASPPAF
ncbi:PREDICTED: uncharacterized protein LOC105587156 [Cercocebus atys]|uniref:uncharacterized protein LOC105587156 n=1 Tax=Cercocebus atys TaxID=9531 RepID=UPI0005F37203|nr:PREDICTED: uncharacterized protein LOC105587156 [Cercocebus atys]